MQILINGNFAVNGKFSVKKKLVQTDIEGEYDFEVTGKFATHFYFEEIFSLETDRYLIEDILVLEEDYGSDDHDIIYTFTAKDIKHKHELSDLTMEEIMEIEKDMYPEGDEIYKEGEKDE